MKYQLSKSKLFDEGVILTLTCLEKNLWQLTKRPFEEFTLSNAEELRVTTWFRSLNVFSLVAYFITVIWSFH